jgi:Alginate lyase
MQSLKPALFMLLLVAGCATGFAQIGGTGWVPKAVTFNVQWPTNAPESARYFVTNEPLPTSHCLVYSNDGAFKVGNTTLRRTEQRFTPDYTRGEIQYQSMEMAPSNENSYCIFQIHTGDAQSRVHRATTFMLFWLSRDGGSLHVYGGTELAKNLGGRWFQLNVDHDLATRTIKVWINRKLVWTQRDNGAGDFYLKDGVYQQGHNPSLKMETYITDIRLWTCSGGLAGSSAGEKHVYDP